MLRIVNDILSALDNNNISVLLLLDLSAAFDTLDHQILLSRLNSVFGIQSTALQWFHSYLSDRYQSTSVNNSSSSPSQLMYGVPQGSVLGPILFVLCTTLLSDIIARPSCSMLKRLKKTLTALDSQQMGLSFLRPLYFELTFYLPRGRHVTSMLRVFRVARRTPRDHLCLAKILILYAFIHTKRSQKYLSFSSAYSLSSG